MYSPGSPREIGHSDGCLSPNELDDGWVKKTIEKYQSGQASFTGREIFEVVDYCSKISGSFQTPKTEYQAFLRDMAYIYATEHTRKLLPENFHKEQSDPEIVNRQLNLLFKDGALKKLRETTSTKSNQNKKYRLPFCADESWGTLRRGNRMWPTYTTIPHIGYCSKDGQALPAPISTKREVPTDLSPAQIRSIMMNDDTGLQRVHKEVFYNTGTYKGCLKPAYIWAALERNPETDDLYVSEQVLDRFCPLWRIVLKYKGNLQGFDEGENPPLCVKSDECASLINLKSKDGNSTEDSPGDLTSLVNQMALEIKNFRKEFQDEFKEMKVATPSSEESTVMSTEESISTSEASDEQRVKEDYSEVEERKATNSNPSASVSERNEKHQELETIEKVDLSTGSKGGSSASLPGDGELENNAEAGLPQLVCQNCESHSPGIEAPKASNPSPSAELGVQAQGKGLKRAHGHVDSPSTLQVEETSSNKRRNTSANAESQNLEGSNKEQQAAS